MILIGKTANCLLGAYVIAHSAVLKALDEFVRMHEITRSVKVVLKCLIAVVLVDDDFPYWTSKVEHLVAFTAIFSNICTAHLWIFGVNLDTAVRFADPDFLLECKISAIWRCFPLIFAFYMLNVHHISTSGSFDLLTYKVYHTRWSWYDHILPSYSVFVCRHVTWPCDLDVWSFDLELYVMHGESRDQHYH